jgi:BlaI family penicillinase repressor
MPQPSSPQHPQPLGISDAEWEVIKIVWDRGPLTAGEVVAALLESNPRRRWQPRTIKTLLGRLVKKGAVRCDVKDKRHLYRAAITRDAALRREARSFLARVFDGALVPAVVTFLKESDLSPDEIDQLKQILESEAQR